MRGLTFLDGSIKLRFHSSVRTVMHASGALAERKNAQAEQTLHQNGKIMARCLEKATSEGRAVVGKMVAKESPQRERE